MWKVNLVLILHITNISLSNHQFDIDLARILQRVLKELMAEKMVRLHSHLEQHEVDLSLFTFNWFLTIYVDNIPTETYLRIWDSFLYEGNKVGEKP